MVGDDSRRYDCCQGDLEMEFLRDGGVITCMDIDVHMEIEGR